MENNNNIKSVNKHKKKHNQFPTSTPTIVPSRTFTPTISSKPVYHVTHEPTHHITSKPAHYVTHEPTHHITSKPTHIILNEDPEPVPVPPMNVSNIFGTDPDPVPGPPMNISNIFISDPEPAPVPPMNVSNIFGTDPEPAPVPPMNVSNIFGTDPDPVPIPPLNETYLIKSMNMIETGSVTAGSVQESQTTTFVYLPLVLISAFVGIGFITYKRYKKRFEYTRIPDEDQFQI